MNTFNIFEAIKTEKPSKLEAIRLGGSETAIIPFMAECSEVDAHYCEETELRGWVKCNGPDCLLCSIGKRKDTGYLLPAYNTAAKAVGVLPIPTSRTPHSLLPQLMEVLKEEFKQVLFIARDGSKYQVTSKALGPGGDDGRRAIKEFLDRHKAGEVDVSSIFWAMTNKALGEVPSIKQMAELKGIVPPNAS